MNQNDRDIDLLLRRNVEQQLEGFDWDRQRQMVLQRLAASRRQKPRLTLAIKMAAGVAALLVLAAGYLGLSSLPGSRSHVGAPSQGTAVRESLGDDSLLASTEPTTILLTGSMRGRVLNDPTLALHSVWDQ